MRRDNVRVLISYYNPRYVGIKNTHLPPRLKDLERRIYSSPLSH